MSKAYQGPGQSVKISGISSTIAVGSVYRRSGGSVRYWIGVVTDEIIGTGNQLTTVDGRPILIGDGVAAESQVGDGKGDMMVEGIFTLRLPTSGMLVNDGDPVYANFTSNVASGVTNNQDAAFNRFPISGGLVGFAEGRSYFATTAPFTGLNMVDVKLLGLPLHQLNLIGQ